MKIIISITTKNLAVTCRGIQSHQHVACYCILSSFDTLTQYTRAPAYYICQAFIISFSQCKECGRLLFAQKISSRRSQRGIMIVVFSFQSNHP